MCSRISAFVASILACLAISSAGASAHPRHKHPKPSHASYEPFHGTVGGAGWPVYQSWFAVPACIVNAESHGLVHEHSHPWSSSGLYQIEQSTWKAYGGSTEFPYEASKQAQSVVAARIWAGGRGASQWSTAAACGY